ncbi:hypothetical protein AVEN_233885-1 [Araneus ventricosus]|uniref:Uncharacterized protein n=1 Tax=Araneus ventricosus TaxID=182803 RepID=A0A4Y2UJ86_ARAVE|nr:hypothetical protein AVEN_233885-1 [Araneus ventricosus]
MLLSLVASSIFFFLGLSINKLSIPRHLLLKNVPTYVNFIRFNVGFTEKSKPQLIQFRCDFNEDSEFNAINIRKSVAGGPLCLKNVAQPLLYPTGRTVTREKRKDMMNLLKFIPPIKHDYYKNIRTNRNDGSSNTADEEDIIYIADESI